MGAKGLVRGGDREVVGELELAGDPPDCDTALLSLPCQAVVSDAAREDALRTARRLLEELAAVWGVQVARVPGCRL